MLRSGVAVMAAGLALLSGCTSGSGQPTTPAASSAAPAPVKVSDPAALASLTAAASKTVSGSYRMNVTVTSSSSAYTLVAKVDPPAKATEIVIDNQGQQMTIRLIGTDMYATGLSTMAGKWVHTNVSKIPGVENVLDNFDQTFALLGGIVDLKEGPPGTFTGFTDPKAALSAATTDEQKDSLSKIIASGSAARLPITAKVVDGYLVEASTAYKVEQNGVTEDATVVTKLSDFGKVGAIVMPPQKDIVEVPS